MMASQWHHDTITIMMVNYNYHDGKLQFDVMIHDGITVESLCHHSDMTITSL